MHRLIIVPGTYGRVFPLKDLTITGPADQALLNIHAGILKKRTTCNPSRPPGFFEQTGQVFNRMTNYS